VSFLGYLHRESLIDLYRTHNVLVFPTTINETFGISQVEAMAAGATCISSGNGGAAEVVEHLKSGLVFESGNVEVLTASLRTLVGDPVLWEALARAGRQRALECFDIECSVDQMERAFERLVMVSRRHRSGQSPA
jgi:glycosyltransferase involved in cell wall biosynthesis